MCISHFSDDVLCIHILNMRGISEEEKDMYIIGSLVESNKESTKRGMNRKHPRQYFMFSREKVCKRTFMLSFDFGKHFFRRFNPYEYSGSSSTQTWKHWKETESFPEIRRYQASSSVHF